MFWYILLSVIFVTVLFNLYTLKFRNYYTLQFVFGRKGSGKSSYLVKQMIKHVKKGWTVYTNMNEFQFPSVRYIDAEDLDIDHIPPKKSLVVLDEIGCIYDSRKFKSFRDEVRDFFKLQRHCKVKVICASQTWDIDKKIRDLTDSMILCEKWFGIFSVCRHISRTFTLTQPNGDSESRIADCLVFQRFLIFPKVTFTFIPRYSKYFDSFVLPDSAPLPYCELHYDKIPVCSIKKYNRICKKINRRRKRNCSIK